MMLAVFLVETMGTNGEGFAVSIPLEHFLIKEDSSQKFIYTKVL